MPTDSSEIARAYDLWAGSYDADANRTRELAADALHRSDLNLASRNVIEIGCGTGRNTAWLAEKAASVVGMDFSEGMLRQAKAHVTSPRIQFIRQDIRRDWPLADGAADVVVAMLVLEHVENLEPVLAEAGRVLRPDGELFLCELHPMRQLLGRQAEFVHPQSGVLERIAAYLHDVSEYVNGALAAGFQLRRLDEWRNPALAPAKCRGYCL